MNHKNGNRVHKRQNPLKACNAFKGVCEIKSVNRHSMISDGTVSS